VGDTDAAVPVGDVEAAAVLPVGEAGAGVELPEQADVSTANTTAAATDAAARRRPMTPPEVSI